MAKYVYPAILTPEDKGAYSVHFPDIESCYTCGDDMADAIDMAEDVLCLLLYDMEQDGNPIPPASKPRGLTINENEITSMISVDTETYRRYYENKSVKKTLSIPMWLNTRAEKTNVNFSGILQEALKKHLQIH
jgi:predicted RNase H-like HicB family nuclease